MRSFVLFVILVGGCAQGGNDRSDAGATDGKPGDGPGAIDAAIDAPGTPAGAPLLLTEIVLTPTLGEYVEIANPTNQTVDLSAYFLADNGTYFRLPAGVPAVDATDFIVKFPAGATIGPKAAITVALDTAGNFSTTYGVSPSFSITGGTMVSVAANGAPSLTNGGEVMVLFRWNGQDDLVRDVDIVLAGVPSAANGLVDKSAIAVDGPDADTTPTAYKADARTIAAQPTAAGTGLSTKRIMLEAGHETQAGTGNGITGDDETSEATGVTWDTTFTAPTPGVLPAGLLP